MPYWSSGVMFGVNSVPNGVSHGQAAGERLAAAHRVAGDTVAGAGEVLALLDQRGLVGRCSGGPPPECRLSPPDQRTAAGAAAATTTAESANRDLRFICCLSKAYCGSLPQASGVFIDPAGAGTGLGGAVCVESHAATAVTSSSVRREAICCMQSGAFA